jgi:hypothetical protein
MAALDKARATIKKIPPIGWVLIGGVVLGVLYLRAKGGGGGTALAPSPTGQSSASDTTSSDQAFLDSLNSMLSGGGGGGLIPGPGGPTSPTAITDQASLLASMQDLFAQ